MALNSVLICRFCKCHISETQNDCCVRNCVWFQDRDFVPSSKCYCESHRSLSGRNDPKMLALSMVSQRDACKMHMSTATLPQVLEFVRGYNGKKPVVSRIQMSPLSIFGPMCAPPAPFSGFDTSSRNPQYHFRDGNGFWSAFQLESESCNWMKHVIFTPDRAAANTLAVHFASGIYFVTVKEIVRDELLRVSYSSSYERELLALSQSVPRCSFPLSLSVIATPQVQQVSHLASGQSFVILSQTATTLPKRNTIHHTYLKVPTVALVTQLQQNMVNASILPPPTASVSLVSSATPEIPLPKRKRQKKSTKALQNSVEVQADIVDQPAESTDVSQRLLRDILQDELPNIEEPRSPVIPFENPVENAVDDYLKKLSQTGAQLEDYNRIPDAIMELKTEPDEAGLHTHAGHDPGAEPQNTQNAVADLSEFLVMPNTDPNVAEPDDNMEVTEAGNKSPKKKKKKQRQPAKKSIKRKGKKRKEIASEEEDADMQDDIGDDPPESDDENDVVETKKRKRRNTKPRIRIRPPLTEEFFCSKCGKHYLSKSDFTIHESKCTVEPTGLPLEQTRCMICKEEIPTGETRTHYATHEVDGKYPCPECGKAFGDPVRLSVHVRMGTHEAKEFPCLVCQKSFKTKGMLTDHMGVHVPNSLPCPHCPETFSGRSARNYHIRAYHKEGGLQLTRTRPRTKDSKQRRDPYEVYFFKCHPCRLGFNGRHLFKDHLSLVHPELDQSLVRELQLPRRVQTAYRCRICRAFNLTEDRAKRHVEKHTKEQLEKIKTPVDESLLMHDGFTRTYQSEVYYCDKCDRPFDAPTDFLDHAKRFHRDWHDQMMPHAPPNVRWKR